MPPIPKLTHQDKNELKPSKDYIQENKTKIINSLPICPRRYIVSDRKGNKFLIDGSGLQKDFIYKKVITLVQTSKIVFKFIDIELWKNPIISPSTSNISSTTEWQF
jgi:hypothetical protein